MLRNAFFLPSIIKYCVLCNACYELLYSIMSIIKYCVLCNACYELLYSIMSIIKEAAELFL